MAGRLNTEEDDLLLGGVFVSLLLTEAGGGSAIAEVVLCAGILVLTLGFVVLRGGLAQLAVTLLQAGKIRGFPGGGYGHVGASDTRGSSGIGTGVRLSVVKVITWCW